ncbi:MAG: hypothetical protein ACLPXB_05795 [Thiobacillaceae bacterium]
MDFQLAEQQATQLQQQSQSIQQQMRALVQRLFSEAKDETTGRVLTIDMRLIALSMQGYGEMTTQPVSRWNNIFSCLSSSSRVIHNRCCNLAGGPAA